MTSKPEMRVRLSPRKFLRWPLATGVIAFSAYPLAAQSIPNGPVVEGTVEPSVPQEEVAEQSEPTVSTSGGMRGTEAGRTNENAVESARDAFGTRVGRETIGLYGPGSVRGFSPTVAGNVRIEGLYFDQQSGLTGRVQSGSRILVGAAAQSDPFPAPTGIVDISLRSSANPGASALLLGGPYESYGAEADVRFPVGTGPLSATIGFGAYRNRFANGGSARAFSFGSVGRGEIGRDLDLLVFWGRTNGYDETAPPIYIPRQSALPPRIERGSYDGPAWALRDGLSDNLGAVLKLDKGVWKVDVGIFQSIDSPFSSFGNLVANIDDRGFGHRLVFANPSSRFASRSGEMRVARTFDSGELTHRFLASVRGRTVASRYGGSQLLDLGRSRIGEFVSPPKPFFVFGPQTTDDVRQITGGASYALRWSDNLEIGAGLQLANYRKSVNSPGTPQITRRSTDLLPNFTVSFSPAGNLLLYGSYTVGLEQNGQVPDFAENRLTLLPALITNQYDLGARWSPNDGLSLIVGYFRIEKPYFNIDPQGFFRQLGDVTHEGIEFSARTRLSEGLNLVGGIVLKDPRVSTSTVIEGVGGRPVGQPFLIGQANLDYVLPWFDGISVDGSLNFTGTQKGDVANLVDIPSFATVSLGARYRFKAGGNPVTLRVSVSNLTNRFEWVPVGSGVYEPLNQRTLQAYLAVDF